jgi:hypothetical protein
MGEHSGQVFIARFANSLDTLHARQPPDRVTRLGESSLIRRLFTLGTLMENTVVAQKFDYFFQGSTLVLAKNGWATFWAIFSQTHLVTLPPDLLSQRETRRNSPERHI